MDLRKLIFRCLFLAAMVPCAVTLTALEPLSPDQLLCLKTAGGIELSPDGEEFIYSVSTPRGANDPPGPSFVTWYRGSVQERSTTPLLPDKTGISAVQYSPDGKYIGFLYSPEKRPRQVWVMESSGGEMVQLTDEPSEVSYFRWHPDSRAIAFLSQDPPSEKEKELKERGYDFIYYEENLKRDHLTLVRFDEQWREMERMRFEIDGNPWDFEFNLQGSMIASSVSPEKLIDHRYMFRKIQLINVSSGETRIVSGNEGKLGNYAFSPDGKHLAYTAARNINDNAVSQLYTVELSTGKVSNLTPDDFRGHVEWVHWKDSGHLFFISGEGVYPRLSVIPLNGGERKIVLDGSEQGVIFGIPSFGADRKHCIFIGSTPGDPSNLYYWDGNKELQSISELNPALKDVSLGAQEVIRYTARDGQEIEGIVIHPVGYRQDRTYPLIVYIHGGPESHHENGWLSSYSTPGQVMAGKGYLVLYLNYRASTGYGVDFAMEGFMDPAGREFDDIADGIEWAVREKGADPERVGLAGGSYGGYASAWFATYYTRYVKAVCMFVGISDLISKRGTTDIPWEERYVHSGKPLEEQWQMNLERSPIYWAHQSRTATLIYGGAADTRVHPSQSLELYRRMKMNGHPAVRLVQYPGERHGNRNQVGRIDVLYRQIGWLDWYVRDLHPINGPMPPLDISDQYGLDFSNKQDVN